MAYQFWNPLHQRAAKEEASKHERIFRLLHEEIGGSLLFGEKLTFAKQPQKPIRSFLIPFFIAVANESKSVVKAVAGSWNHDWDERKASHAHFILWSQNPILPSVVKRLWKHGIASVSKVRNIEACLHYCFLQHEIEVGFRDFHPRFISNKIA